MPRGAARPWSARLALFVAVGCRWGVAMADPPVGSPGLSLTWDAPEGCPTRAQILENVARVVGVPPRDRLPEPLDATVRMGAEGASWRADVTLVTKGESSSRHVEGQSCREVSDAACRKPRICSGAM